ncbi:MAG: ATP synthase F1 subunit delta [Erysipelotrichaceae bacterium]|nr:ATP synthase F1 subunit delta [Erysipelotrichaceae bacterium]
MSLVAKRYAEGLFSLAKDYDKVSLYKDEIKLVKECFDKAEIRPFFASGRISREEKKQFCREIFRDGLDTYVLNFLCVLIDKDRITAYRDIFDEFVHLCNRELDITEGIIETARPVDKKLIEELEKVLEKDGQRVELKETVNRSLISGFRISLENRVIDNSMKNRISDLEDSLLRKDGSLWN